MYINKVEIITLGNFGQKQQVIKMRKKSYTLEKKNDYNYNHYFCFNEN